MKKYIGLLAIALLSGCASLDARTCSVSTTVAQPVQLTRYAEALKDSGSFTWPLRGNVVGFFGQPYGSIKNKGVQIRPGADTSVKAAREGEVVFSNHVNGWGKIVIIKHIKGYYSVYANLHNATVVQGECVAKGMVVGSLASGKKKADAVLHFEIRKGHTPENPLVYLR